MKQNITGQVMKRFEEIQFLVNGFSKMTLDLKEDVAKTFEVFFNMLNEKLNQTAIDLELLVDNNKWKFSSEHPDDNEVVIGVTQGNDFATFQYSDDKWFNTWENCEHTPKLWQHINY